jgi:hypothetical protein
VSVWRIWAAPTPWHLRCGHCGAKLWVRKWTWPIGIVVLVPAIVLAVVLRREVSAGSLTRTAWLLIMIGFAAAADLLASLLVCRAGTLRVRGGPDPPAA